MTNIVKKEQLMLTLDYTEQQQVRLGNLEDIQESLPKLYPEQQEDVQQAEIRFRVGKGYMFTNGTGTGKTFVSLGIMKRFALQGKKNILVVVPTEAKCKDWMMEAEHLQLVIRPLRDIRDKGNDIVVTTYANFYQNDALEDRDWDLIVYDECHYLNQNAKGDDTVYLEKHRRVANLPSAAKEKILDRYRQRPVPEEFLPMTNGEAPLKPGNSRSSLHH